MFSPDDTIVAIATPPGRGALGIVRISGAQAQQVASALLPAGLKLRPRYATLTTVDTGVDSGGRAISAEPLRTPGTAAAVRDHVVVTLFSGPHSGTGEDVVEVSAHGSPVVLSAIVQAAMRAGARLARPGEFSLRAYLHGKLDLPQAEAVRDLVDALTPVQAASAVSQLEGGLSAFVRTCEEELFDLTARLEASLDFPDEGFHFLEPSEAAGRVTRLRESLHARLTGARRGRVVREGLRVAIVGAPNAGKSSLFNALLQEQRAIVAAEAGTTRDLLTESIDLRGYLVRLIDTAGLREGGSEAEREGIRRAEAAAREASLRLVVVDGSRPLDANAVEVLARTASQPRIVVVSKSDLPAAHDSQAVIGVRECPVHISARTGEGMTALVERILECGVGRQQEDEAAGIADVRHVPLIERAEQALARAEQSLLQARPVAEEFLLADLRIAVSALQEVTGQRPDDELFARIFSTFCLGK